MYIRSKFEIHCTLWSPSKPAEIDDLERIQKLFTSKIEGLENLSYQILKGLNYTVQKEEETDIW